MKIEKKQESTTLIIALEGKLDTVTSPELASCVQESIEGIKTLIFDFANLEYISSAGLRVLLSAQKAMNKQGQMVVKNVSETVGEVFEITGFSDILTIE